MPYYPVVAAHWWDGVDYRPVEFLGDPTPPAQAPSVPTGLDYEALSQSSVRVTWAASTGNVNHYDVSRNGVVVASPGAPTADLTGLSAGASYGVRVRAVPDAGDLFASAWSSELVVTTLPPVVSGTLFGFASDNIAGSQSRIGPAEVGRFYRNESQSTSTLQWPPSGWPTDISFIYSFKPNITNLLAGSLDAMILTFLAKLPTTRPTWVIIWHEHDVKSMNPAQFIAAQNYFGALVRNFGNPMIRMTICMGGYKAPSVQATYRPNLDLVDCWMADPYSAGQAAADRTTYAGGRKVIAQYLTNFADQYLPSDMPLGIGEIGVATGTDAQRAAWLRGATDVIRERNMQASAYFDIDLGDLEGSPQITSAFPQTAQVWRDAMAA